MRFTFARGLMLALGLVGATCQGLADESLGAGSLLPIPSLSRNYQQIQPVGYSRRMSEEAADTLPAPGEPATAMPAPQPTIGSGYDYQKSMTQSWQQPAGCESSSCSNGACASNGYADDYSAAGCGLGSCVNNPRWFVYGGGLVMGRVHSANTILATDATTFQGVLGDCHVRQPWAGGFETRAGRAFAGGCGGIEAGYWGLFPNDSTFTTFPATGSSFIPNMPLDQLTYDDGAGTVAPVYDWFANAQILQLQRSTDINTFQVNFLGNPNAFGYGYGYSGCGPRLSFGWLAGFRYLRFNERLTFIADDQDAIINNTVGEITYNSRYQNSIAAFQVGGIGNIYLNQCFSVFARGTFGVGNNHISGIQSVHGQNGFATVANGPWAGENYDVHSTRNSTATYGEVDLGGRYQVNGHWNIAAGYRVIGVCGLATPSGNVPANFADINQVSHINAGSCVILHGAFAGVTYIW